MFDLFMYVFCIVVFLVMWSAPLFGAMAASNKVETNEEMFARWAKEA